MYVVCVQKVLVCVYVCGVDYYVLLALSHFVWFSLKNGIVWEDNSLYSMDILNTEIIKITKKFRLLSLTWFVLFFCFCPLTISALLCFALLAFVYLFVCVCVCSYLLMSLSPNTLTTSTKKKKERSVLVTVFSFTINPLNILNLVVIREFKRVWRKMEPHLMSQLPHQSSACFSKNIQMDAPLESPYSFH